MPVPVDVPKVLESLRQTLISCATFRQLCGAVSPEAARAFVYDRFARDDWAGDTDETDPDRQPVDPFPRAVLLDGSPQSIQIGGGRIWGTGALTVFLEYKQFTDDELTTWYSTSITDATDKDHWNHADNLKVAIRNEMIALAQTAGCLTIVRLTEEVVGLIDPVNNRGLNIWLIAFRVDWEGLP